MAHNTFSNGTEVVDLHIVCHAALHHILSEREMQHHYNTVVRLLEHEEIQKFVKWIKNKPNDFYAKHKDTAERKKKRRR